MQDLVRLIGRGLLAPGLVLLCMAFPAAASAELPKDEDALVAMIRSAIETKDYDSLARLVFWKDAGKIKKRIVRFHLSRNLGRKIKAITIEPYPEDGLAGAVATGKLAPNMKVSHAVRVVFDEPPINASGKLPTSVFLVGKRKDVFRIGLVNRAGFDDDDD